ncbi:MAG TPA: hypothetical protein VF844_22365, partial [Ktedonobacteraceae bacterium]
HAFLHHEKPPPCLAARRLVALRRLVVGLHRDGSYMGAGDGARTGDSLLGRQELYPHCPEFVASFLFHLV